MNVFLLGNGAREHALGWKLVQSPKVHTLFVSDPNPGLLSLPKTQPTPKHPSHEASATWAKAQNIDLTLVGPEQPLAEGMVDLFRAEGLTIFGPTQAAAQLETSKLFAKDIMQKAHIPTAKFEEIPTLEKAHDLLEATPAPYVLKVSGLAAGKGVVVTASKSEALTFCKHVLEQKIFGDQKLYLEEHLSGQEVSLFALVHEEHYCLFPSAQDHKRLCDNDQGPNTGGMGAYTPVPAFTLEQKKLTEETILKPLLQTMKAQGTPFTGLLFIGLMLTQNGPKVLEFNVRFGDPETQSLVRTMDFDLAEVLLQSALGNIPTTLPFTSEAAMGVVLAAQGYPRTPRKGDEITGLENVKPPVVVFHAGTQQSQGHLLTNGGRVLTVTSTGKTLREAQQKILEAIEDIHFKDKQFRKDIGWRAL